jgi:hypothetical protein
MWCRVGAVRHGMRWEGGDRLDMVGGFGECWGIVGLVGSGGGFRGWTWGDVDNVEGSHSYRKDCSVPCRNWGMVGSGISCGGHPSSCRYHLLC